MSVILYQGVDKLKQAVTDAIETLEIFSMPKRDRIKLWIKHTVIYEFDHHKTFIDTSYIKHSSDKSLMCYYRECVSEVKRMKKDKMYNKFSLKKFVTDGYSHIKGLRDKEFMQLCISRTQIAQQDMYPIYGDMVLDKARETYFRLSGDDEYIWRCSYRKGWEDMFRGKTVKLRIGKCRCVAVIDNDTGVGKFRLLENAFPNWEKLKSFYEYSAKQVLKIMTLRFSKTPQLLLKIVDLNQYRDLICYHFLLTCYNTCLSETKQMQKDKISEFQTLYTFLDLCFLNDEAMPSTDAFIDKSIFVILLKGKYELYRGDIAKLIRRSFLNDMMVGRCISLEVSDNSSQNVACAEGLKQLILYPHITQKVCDYLNHTELLDLVLAFFHSYNSPNCVKNLHPSRKRKNAPSATCKRLTRSKKYC